MSKRNSRTSRITLRVDFLPDEDSMTLLLPVKALSHFCFMRTTANHVLEKFPWSELLVADIWVQWRQLLMYRHILRRTLTGFEATRDKKKGFLLADDLNVDGQVWYDQRTRRDKSFITWIVCNLNFHIFVTTHRMAIVTPIIWLDDFLHWSQEFFVFFFFFLSEWNERDETEVSCGIWITCFTSFKTKTNIIYVEKKLRPSGTEGKGLEFVSHRSFLSGKAH